MVLPPSEQHCLGGCTCELWLLFSLCLCFCVSVHVCLSACNSGIEVRMLSHKRFGSYVVREVSCQRPHRSSPLLVSQLFVTHSTLPTASTEFSIEKRICVIFFNDFSKCGLFYNGIRAFVKALLYQVHFSCRTVCQEVTRYDIYICLLKCVRQRTFWSVTPCVSLGR